MSLHDAPREQLLTPRASEAQLRLIADTVPPAITHCGRDLRYLWVSKHCADWLGQAPEAMVGRPIEDVIGPEAFAAIRPYVERVLAGENVEYEAEVNYRAVGPRWIHAAYRPASWAGGVVESWVAVITDITARKRTEEALRASEQRLAVELAGMTRLQQVSTRLVQSADAVALLQEIIDAAITITAADMGNMQLLDRETGTLRFVASSGLGPAFLEHFGGVRYGRASCGVALQTGTRVVVADVTDSLFTGEDLDVMLAAGARAVQSTPLVTRSGQLVGMLSTHYRTPRVPADRDLHVLDLLARQAADWIERTQAEDALRESEARFRNMADNSPVIIWVTDATGAGTYVNQRWCQFTGTTPEQGLGFGWLDCVHPEDREPMSSTFRAANEKREAFRLEYRLLRHDGAYRWAIDSAAPRFGASGEFLGYIGSVLDVTEEKRQEQVRQASAERQTFLLRLSDTLRSQPDAEAIGAVSTRLLAACMHVDRCFVDRVSQAEGLAWVGPEYRRPDLPPVAGEYRLADFPESIRQAETETLVIGDLANDPRLSDLDKASIGALGMAAVIAVPLRKGERNFIWALVVGTARPRSWTREELQLVEETAERTWAAAERAQAEVSLRESEEKYRLLFSSETDAILLFDQQTGAVLEANDAAVGVYGYPRHAFPPITELETADGPSLAGRTAATPRDAGTTGLDVRWHRRHSGAVFPAEIAANRFTWQRRTVVFAVVRDISDRLQTQERERQLRAELARVGRLSLTSAIASGLAHELNQPLTAILTYTDACLRLLRSPASDPADVREALERIAVQARRASDVVRGTRNVMARPEPARGRVPVRALLDEVLQLDEFELQAKNIRVALAGPPARVDVLADRLQIVQVLLNLIRNAVDAMETTAPDDRDLTIRADLTGPGEVRLAVHDRGCGLAPHIRERLGQPFQTTKPHGTGLGLAISWTIVEAHGGRLWAEPNDDGGTTFYFTAPVLAQGKDDSSSG